MSKQETLFEIKEDIKKEYFTVTYEFKDKQTMENWFQKHIRPNISAFGHGNVDRYYFGHAINVLTNGENWEKN